MSLTIALLPALFAGASLPAVDATADVRQSYQRWEQRLRNKVGERNFLSADALNNPACTVVVGFKVGRDQRPDDVEVVNSSCDSFYDRQAQRLVRELGRVGKVPSISGSNYRIMLNLSYGRAPDPAGDRTLTEALTAERRLFSRRNVEIVTADGRLAAGYPGEE